jgi:hypothetical protein
MNYLRLEPSGRCCAPHLVNETLGPHGTEQPETLTLDLSHSDSDKKTRIVKEQLTNSDRLLLLGATTVIGYGLYHTFRNRHLN